MQGTDAYFLSCYNTLSRCVICMTVIKVLTGTQFIALTSQSIKQTELINQLITVDTSIRTNHTKGLHPWPMLVVGYHASLLRLHTEVYKHMC